MEHFSHFSLTIILYNIIERKEALLKIIICRKAGRNYEKNIFNVAVDILCRFLLVEKGSGGL